MKFVSRCLCSTLPIVKTIFSDSLSLAYSFASYNLIYGFSHLRSFYDHEVHTANTIRFYRHLYTPLSRTIFLLNHLSLFSPAPVINPRRACARVTVVVLCVCLSVYPSVPALAASASVETSKQRYSRVSLRLFLE